LAKVADGSTVPQKAPGTPAPARKPGPPPGKAGKPGQATLDTFFGKKAHV
jgi:hypothetical protein